MLKRIISIVIILLLTMTIVVGCNNNDGAQDQEQKQEQTQDQNEEKQDEAVDNEQKDKTIILATTTSTENSGLLDHILPAFKEKTGIETKVVAVGTGKALQMGMDGEADVLLVHAKSSEEKFVSDGHGTKRYDVMYNDFVIIGPEDDPADLLTKSNDNAAEALKVIASTESKFVSRGDDSGTHKKEKSLWENAEVSPEGDWYISAGKGMGAVIQMANEILAYTMADRGTFLSMKDDIDLKVVVEGDPILFNQYGVIPVNPQKNEKINDEGANKFVEWLLSEDTQEVIGEFGTERFGQPLFVPNAK